jgi:hypothetical protein
MRTQSQFLRLRRTKIGLRDFRTVKVIGKGAFGEVSVSILGSLRRFLLPRRRRPAPCVVRGQLFFVGLSLVRFADT